MSGPLLDPNLESIELPPTCEWREDDDGYWATSCGEMFALFTGRPVENRMRFCPYCGKGLIEVAAATEDDDV